MTIPFNERRALDDAARRAEGANLINIDHAREARRRFLSAEEREERGLPGPAIAACLLVGGFVLAGTALYFGSRIVMWLLLVIASITQ